MALAIFEVFPMRDKPYEWDLTNPRETYEVADIDAAVSMIKTGMVNLDMPGEFRDRVINGITESRTMSGNRDYSTVQSDGTHMHRYSYIPD